MRITLHIYYTGAGRNARRFAREMEKSGKAAAIRAEEGNISYEYYFPAREPGTVLLIDSWQDQAALDAHHATPMMNAVAALRSRHDLHMRVERYFSDDGGIPHGDEAFIRR